MRKIESDMLAAIKDGRNWQSGNTQVTHHRSDVNAGMCSVFLHGNRVALWDRVTGKAVAVNHTFVEYPTRTTVSRLRALGIDACVRKGVPMIDGEPV